MGSLGTGSGRALRRRFYAFMASAFATDDGRRIACEAVSSLGARHPRSLLRGSSLFTPYPELGRPQTAPQPSDRSDVVIITGRFRSGSTLLWNLFRRQGEFTAYYEPFNERRWFDPMARGNGTDSTHRNVSNYWHEYDGLDILGRFYHEDWIRRHLLMDEHSWAPEMKQYVDTLIDDGPQGRAGPAIQPHRFPIALVPVPLSQRNLHPRVSPSEGPVVLDAPGRSETISQGCLDRRRFAHLTEFYLRMWTEDLKYHFPVSRRKT